MKVVSIILTWCLLGASSVAQASVIAAPRGAVTSPLHSSAVRRSTRGSNNKIVTHTEQDRRQLQTIDLSSAECADRVEQLLTLVITEVLIASFPTLPEAGVSVLAELVVGSIDLDEIVGPLATFLAIPNPTSVEIQAFFGGIVVAAGTGFTVPSLADFTTALQNTGLGPLALAQLAGQISIFFASGGLSSFDINSLSPAAIQGLIASSASLLNEIAFFCLGLGSLEPSATPSAMPSATPSAMPSATPSAMPSAAPSAAPNSDPPGKTCFSDRTTVDVQGQGPTRMDALKVGDYVLTDTDGTYSELYSFGHYAPETVAEFLQIATTQRKEPLEITRDHMLYVNGKVVPASQVKVGDSLAIAGSSSVSTTQVTTIRTVQRRGVYAPFTKSGDIVVNGLVASNYIALPPTLHEHLSFEQQQWIQHAALTPVRAYCGAVGGCHSETHNDDTGYTKPVAVLMHISHLVSQYLQNHPVLLSGFLYLFALPLLWAFVNMSHILAAALGYYVWKQATKKGKNEVVEKPLKA